MENYKSWTWTRYVLKGPKLWMRQNMPLHVATLRADTAEWDSQHVAAACTDGTEQACMDLQYFLMGPNKFLHVSAHARSCNGKPDDR